jgi:Rod binding domain-containing protein
MDAPLTYTAFPAPRMNPLAARAAEANPGASTGASTGAGAGKGVSPEKAASLRKSADEFEGMFLSQMLSHMFDQVEVDENFGGGKGEEMFRSMQVTEYGKQISQRGGLGISNSVYRELLKAQEASHGQG